MIRLVNDRLTRILHDALHERLVHFCEQYTKEALAEPIVQSWLQRLYASDDRLHILVTLDNRYTITEHMVIDIQTADTGIRSVHCYQAQGSKPNLDSVAEGIEYMDKLALAVGATFTIFYVAKHSKALQRYGYNDVRTVMLKYTNTVPHEE